MTKILIDRKLVEQALEALTHGCPPDCKDGMTDSGGAHPWGEPALIPCPNCESIAALRSALAEPVQEPKPVAWRFEARHIDSAWAAAVTLKHPGPEGVYMRNLMPLYAHPPQRKPVEWDGRCMLGHCNSPAGCENSGECRAVERAHGVGGGG